MLQWITHDIYAKHHKQFSLEFEHFSYARQKDYWIKNVYKYQLRTALKVSLRSQRLTADIS